jgi:hypothetical protein
MPAKIQKIVDPFIFEQGGKSYQIPKFSNLPAGALRRARKASDDLDKAFTIIEFVMGDESPEIFAVDSMTVSEFGDFVKAWTGGTSVGESSGS